MEQNAVITGHINNAAILQHYRARYENGVTVEPMIPSRARPRFEVRDVQLEFPVNLSSRAQIKLQPDHRSSAAIMFSFGTAAEALIAMDSYEFQVAALWLSLDLLCPKEVDGFREAFIGEAPLRAHGTSVDDAAGHVVQKSGVDSISRMLRSMS